MRPMGNLDRTLKLFCLKTGLTLKWKKWTEYPMPQQVIKKVNKWVKIYNKKEYGEFWSLGIALKKNPIGTLKTT